jgi:WD40 repeat protein
VVSCAASYANFLFVGNSQGYIRVFDLQAKQVKDLKPLYDRQLFENKVMCLDITEGMKYLVAGYKSGVVALWDLK